MKSIFKNVFLITLFTMLTRTLGFFFRIFLSRTIGAEALGIYQVAMSVFMVLLTIVSSGFTLVISRMTAGYRVNEDKRSIGSLISACTILGLIVSISLCSIVFLFRNLFSNLFTDENCINILIILLPSLIFSSVYSVFRGAMWGKDNYFGLCISELFEQIIKIVIFVLLIASGMTAIEYAMSVAWSFTLSCILSAFFVILLYFLYGGKLNRPTKIYKDVIRASSPITAVRVVSSLTWPLVALILPNKLIAVGYTSSQAISLYGIAMGMTFPLLLLPSAFIGSLSTALVPDISMAMTKNDKNHIEKRVQSSVDFSMFISFLIVPTFLAIGDKFGLLLYNNAISGKLLQFATWIMVPMGINNIATAVLNSVGLEVKSFLNYVVGSIFLFLSIILLPRFCGINSVIIGLGLSSLVSCILNIFMIKRKLKIKLNILKDLVKFTLISLPTLALTSFVSALFSYIMPLFFDITLSTFLGICTYTILCYVFNVINLGGVWTKTKQKFFVMKRKKT